MEKRIFLLSIYILLAAVLTGQNAGQLFLQSGWKFRTGDSLQWKSPEYNHQEWKDVLPDEYWDYLHDFDYDGYAWYRIKFFLPSSMKEGLKKNDSIYFKLGKIDDNDQTFLNGTIIGQNAKNVSSSTSEEFADVKFVYDLPRNYGIPVNSEYIRWDSVNTLAIRVYDIWYTGGICNPKPGIFTKKSWEDKIIVREKTKHPALFNIGEISEVSFVVGNKNPEQKLEALFIADLYTGKANQPVYTHMKNIQVEPGKEVPVQFEFRHLVEDFYHVSYKIIEKTVNYSFGKKELFGLVKRNITLHEKPLKTVVQDKVPTQYQPVHQSQQQIDGYLGFRMDVNIKKGLSVFPQQFIEPYFTIEEPRWPVGEMAKAMHGSTKMLQYEKNEKMFEVLQSVVLIWIEQQKENGYIGNYRPENRWTVWDAWDHKYVLLGLIKFYSITGYEPALEASKKIGDLMCKTFGNDDSQIDIVANGPNKGMASGSILEPMVYLYKYTGKKEYLDFCNYILSAYEQENGPQIVSELTDRSGTVYKVGNGKGYEMLSCIIGIVQMYKLTGQEELLNAALIAWEDIVKNRLYITGTATEFEHFQEAGQLGAGKEHHMGEGCVTAHWMYLSKELFKLKGDQKYMDEINKSLYNHLLAAQHPITGNIVYYTALQDAKYYLPFDLNVGPPPCCHFSVKRCITEIPEFSFYQKENEIGINLYNPSGFNTTIITKKTEVPVDFTIHSSFPVKSDVRITVKPSKKSDFTVSLRVPDWTTNFRAVIGNEEYKGIPGAYLKIQRKWQPGDMININMDFPVSILEGGKSYPGHYAVKYGPRVLAVDGDVNCMNDLDKVVFEEKENVVIKPYTGKMPENWIGRQSYITNVVKTADGKDIILVPFAEASQTGGDIRVWIKKK